MAGRVADNRVRYGSLKLEDCANPGTMLAFDCVPTAVAIVPGSNENAAEDSIEVLCGAQTAGSAATTDRTATLNVTLVSDFLEQGLVAYSWKCEGTRAFEWTPNANPVKVDGSADANTPAQVWRGTVRVTPIEVGGEVNTRLTPSVSWTVDSLELPALYGGGLWIGVKPGGILEPADPALEWLFTPANAMLPTDLAALKADASVGDSGTAKPGRDFTTGEFALISGGVKVHFATSGGWATGEAQ